MISVCIATYNGARYIAEQLASILKQLSAEDEVVVSDDGSTDGTIDIVRSFNDRRIRIVDGPRRPSKLSVGEWRRCPHTLRIRRSLQLRTMSIVPSVDPP